MVNYAQLIYCRRQVVKFQLSAEAKEEISRIYWQGRTIGWTMLFPVKNLHSYTFIVIRTYRTAYKIKGRTLIDRCHFMTGLLHMKTYTRSSNVTARVGWVVNAPPIQQTNSQRTDRRSSHRPTDQVTTWQP